MEAVHRYEGTVNQVMGDGIMALFGAPLAHEDHAVRACYAALRMQEAVKRYAEGIRREQGISVRIRVGRFDHSAPTTARFGWSSAVRRLTSSSPAGDSGPVIPSVVAPEAHGARTRALDSCGWYVAPAHR